MTDVRNYGTPDISRSSNVLLLQNASLLSNFVYSC